MATVAPHAASVDKLIGLIADRYRLTRKLGEGGMGLVYAAERVDTGERCAVKMLHAAFVQEPEVLARFFEEARTCQRLAHPNIIRVLDTGYAPDGAPFLVMELLDGVPLSAYTANGGRVPLAPAVAILQGMLSGLEHAHAQGIVHRDLKPENVFLARDAAGAFFPKILDFGIAKVMDAAGGAGKRTSTGMLLGTPAYMSPEQIKDSKDVDPRSDLFAIAVLFYEMLTGRPAFPAENEFARLSAVLLREPEPIGSVDPRLEFLAAFFARGLHKDRNQRFQSASEMASAVPRPDDAGRLSSPAAPPLAAAISASRLPAASPAPPSPGGTLASANPQRPIAAAPAPPPEIVMVPPVSTAAPDERRGIARWVAAVLVAAAFCFGFVLGIAVARL